MSFGNLTRLLLSNASFSQNLLWYGGYYGNLSRITVTYPHPELPGLIHLVFNDAPGYTTTIATMEDAVMVTDSPPHQSKLVIQWIHQNLKRKVTHLLVTHHHRENFLGPFYETRLDR